MRVESYIEKKIIPMSEPQLDRREMTLMQKLSIPEAADPPWSSMIATLMVIVLLITLMFVGIAMASILLGIEGNEYPPFALMLGWMLGEAITIAFVLINRRSSQESWLALRLSKGHLPIPFVVMVGVATALFVDLVISLASGDFLPIPEIYGFQAEGVAGILVAILFVALIQPIAESLVFQGVLLPKLRFIMGAWGGVVVTTVVYTLVHFAVFYSSYPTAYPQSTMLWYGVAYPLLTGLMFCLMKIYTNSTRAVIVMRIGAGLTFVLTALVLVSG